MIFNNHLEPHIALAQSYVSQPLTCGPVAPEHQ